MHRYRYLGIVVALLAVVSAVRGEDCQVFNGSFEIDEWINDLALEDPNGWDVNMPTGKFRGYVRSDWVTDGGYNLTLYADWFVQYNAGDMATVSQQIDLTDVNEVLFDLRLDTFNSTPWDPNTATAVILIGDDVVWDSNQATSDVRGEYIGQSFVVGDKYRDGQPHTLALGLKINVTEMLFERFITQWDMFTCTLFCNGGGLLSGDINRDCYVETNDLALLVDAWLHEVDPDSRCNLYREDDSAGYGTIGFGDFAVYALGWDGSMATLGEFADVWLHEVDLDDQHNLFKDDDVAPSGIVNSLDFATLADNWLGSSLLPAEPPGDGGGESP